MINEVNLIDDNANIFNGLSHLEKAKIKCGDTF